MRGNSLSGGIFWPEFLAPPPSGAYWSDACLPSGRLAGLGLAAALQVSLAAVLQAWELAACPPGGRVDQTLSDPCLPAWIGLGGLLVSWQFLYLFSCTSALGTSYLFSLKVNCMQVNRLSGGIFWPGSPINGFLLSATRQDARLPAWIGRGGWLVSWQFLICFP